MGHARIFGRLQADPRAEQHESLSRWAKLCDRATRDGYRDHLVNAYGFETAVESAVAYTPGFKPRLDRRWVPRSGLVAQDLLALGMSPVEVAKLPQCAIPPFADIAQAVGWLCLLQRSTLHAAEWTRRLSAQLDEPDALSYLHAASANAVVRGGELDRLIDAVTVTPDVEDRIVEATLDALTVERAWYLRSER